MVARDQSGCLTPDLPRCYASAIGYVLFGVIFVLTLIQFRFFVKHVEL
jgi:ABC-type sugar transport system permease subunit